jgi:citrate synthase
MDQAARRLRVIENHLTSKATLTVTDNRTGKTYEVPVHKNFIRAKDLSKIKDAEGNVLMYYDPGYMNTITCTSRISYIDGDQGILEYRGYPIEELAEHSSFLEVAYLLIYGELPTSAQASKWEELIMNHTFVHTDITSMMKSFHYDAHPMGMLVSTMSAMSTFQPEQNPALFPEKDIYADQLVRNKQIHRILGRAPTIAAAAYRHRIGRNFNLPDRSKGYVENFLTMLDRISEPTYTPHPKLVRAIEVLFILHAEHELNCSTAAMRHLASSEVDVYTCIAGASAALYGRKHGGANEAVLRMLEEIGDVKQIPEFLEQVKSGKRRLMGFGHRIYKNYDPRAKIVKRIAEEVFSIVGREPLIDIAIELERIALTDQYFIKRKLYPNVDFYTGVIYKSMGFPTDMFPVLFSIPRMAGWLAHWKEFNNDNENQIVRPRQNYEGPSRRSYVPMAARPHHEVVIDSISSVHAKRRNVPS